MKSLNNNISAFTLVEIMVAMVVLAIGLLGMAAMTVIVIRGGGTASDLTAGTNVCSLKMEELRDIQWENLGCSTNSSAADYLTYGLMNAQMALEMDLNSQGKTKQAVADEIASGDLTNSEVTKLGPYRYSRSFVVCKGEDYDGPPSSPTPPDTLPYGSSGDFRSSPAGSPPHMYDCLVDPTDNATRVESLACEGSDITGAPGVNNKEKKIKVLCAWTDRAGDCHSVHMDTTVVKLGN